MDTTIFHRGIQHIHCKPHLLELLSVEEVICPNRPPAVFEGNPGKVVQLSSTLRWNLGVVRQLKILTKLRCGHKVHVQLKSHPSNIKYIQIRAPKWIDPIQDQLFLGIRKGLYIYIYIIYIPTLYVIWYVSLSQNSVAHNQMVHYHVSPLNIVIFPIKNSHLEFSIHPISKHSLLDIQPQASGLLDSVVGVFLGALARLTLILGSRDVVPEPKSQNSHVSLW